MLDEKGGRRHKSVNNELKAFISRFFLTRDLETAKKWVKDKARGTERYGLLASSEGKKRLRAEGIMGSIRYKIQNVGWVLNGKE
ncbi:MAG: hypothetical protein ACLRZG_07665 [Streptococcus sp.]